MLQTARFVVQIITLASTTTLVACATPKGRIPTTDRFWVTASRTPFYHYGPAQATGADYVLIKGQNVTLVKRSFGFSQITTADGQSGYVATDDIVPAPAPTPTPKPSVVPENEYEHYFPAPARLPGDSITPLSLELPLGLPTPIQNQPEFR